MSTADWYARKFGQSPQRRDNTPQQPAYVPAQPQPQYGAPIQQYPQPQEQRGWQDLDQEERRLYLLNNPRPGAGSKDAQSCPECGGELLFSQRNSSGLRTGNMYPAPHCFNCGWPLIQAGSIGGALGHGG